MKLANGKDTINAGGDDMNLADEIQNNKCLYKYFLECVRMVFLFSGHWNSMFWLGLMAQSNFSNLFQSLWYPGNTSNKN